MDHRISLVDIARETGFALPTVSMALRNVGTVSLNSRRIIQDAAQRLGYYPNPLLAALASKHFRAEHKGGTPVAYIHSHKREAKMSINHDPLVKAGQEYGRQLGYRVELFHYSDFKNGAHATKVLFSRGIQGIILSQHLHLNMLPGMDWNRFSVVGWGDTLVDAATSSKIDCATVDHFRVVLDAWDKTWSRGYRKIGFVLFDRVTADFDDRLRWGAVESCLDGVPKRLRIAPLIYKVDAGGMGNSTPLANWVRRHKPDAVIGFNDLIYWLLQKEKFKIPQDLGYASLHKDVSNTFYQVHEQGDSGMKHVRLDALFAALELLDQQIRHHQLGLARQPRILMVRSEWIEGNSLPMKSRI